MNDEDKIVLKRENEQEQEYYKLLQFKDKSTNKEFIVYTDNQKDEKGNINLYSNMIKKGDDKILLKEIDEEDLEKVKEAIINAKLMI